MIDLRKKIPDRIIKYIPSRKLLFTISRQIIIKLQQPESLENKNLDSFLNQTLSNIYVAPFLKEENYLSEVEVVVLNMIEDKLLLDIWEDELLQKNNQEFGARVDFWVKKHEFKL